MFSCVGFWMSIAIRVHHLPFIFSRKGICFFSSLTPIDSLGADESLLKVAISLKQVEQA
jgi:hypothetical protein